MCVCVCVQYAWVEKHLGHDFLEQVILTRDKTLITGDILIDDKPDILGKDRKRVGVCVCVCVHMQGLSCSSQHLDVFNNLHIMPCEIYL